MLCKNYFTGTDGYCKVNIFITQLNSFLEFLTDMGITEIADPQRRRGETIQRKSLELEEIYTHWTDCTRCKLHQWRTNIVFGEGNPDAEVMFIGEGPGEEEDKQGRPFVGRAGQLLTLMLRAIGFEREDVFITNIVKCRPPKNREPEKDEVIACSPLLQKQIEIIDPELIVTLGKPAITALSGEKLSITKIRGRVMLIGGRKVLPTYHPAYLLRNPARKREAWEDLKTLRKLLGP